MAEMSPPRQGSRVRGQQHAQPMQLEAHTRIKPARAIALGR